MHGWFSFFLSYVVSMDISLFLSFLVVFVSRWLPRLTGLEVGLENKLMVWCGVERKKKRAKQEEKKRNTGEEAVNTAVCEANT